MLQGAGMRRLPLVQLQLMRRGAGMQQGVGNRRRGKHHALVTNLPAASGRGNLDDDGAKVEKITQQKLKSKRIATMQLRSRQATHFSC